MHVNYDLRVAPNTFDFATFLANAFMYSRFCNDTIDRVNIYTTGYRSDVSWGGVNPPDAYHEMKIDSVFLPLARLLLDKPSIAILNKFLNKLPASSQEKIFPPRFLPETLPLEYRSAISMLQCNENSSNDLFLKTQIMPHPFSADAHLQSEIVDRWGTKFITFTVRNSKLNPRRNSEASLVELLRKPLIKELNARGLRTVLIPDRENIYMDDPLNCFREGQVDFEAAFCLRRRYALYSKALMNVSPATGPNILLAFSDCPYYIFDTYDENIPVMSKGFFDRKGPKFNQQRPWATNSQFLDWTPRSAKNYPLLLTKILDYIYKNNTCIH